MSRLRFRCVFVFLNVCAFVFVCVWRVACRCVWLFQLRLVWLCVCACVVVIVITTIIIIIYIYIYIHIDSNYNLRSFETCQTLKTCSACFFLPFHKFESFEMLNFLCIDWCNYDHCSKSKQSVYEIGDMFQKFSVLKCLKVFLIEIKNIMLIYCYSFQKKMLFFEIADMCFFFEKCLNAFEIIMTSMRRRRIIIVTNVEHIKAEKRCVTFLIHSNFVFFFQKHPFLKHV